jgi:hypothetical protein
MQLNKIREIENMKKYLSFQGLNAWCFLVLGDRHSRASPALLMSEIAAE